KLMGNVPVEPLIDLQGHYMINDEKIVEIDELRVIKDLLKCIGFNGINDKKRIDLADFENNCKKVMKESIFFKNSTAYFPAFRIRKKLDAHNTIHTFLGTFETVFSNFGFRIARYNGHVRVNKKVVSKPAYYIKF